MIIYLDESGDLGFDLTKTKTSRYLVLTALVCVDTKSSRVIAKSVKRTLKNKFCHSVRELKGTNTSLSVKQYFLKNIKNKTDWKIYSAVADKKKWLKSILKKHPKTKGKVVFYDELAKKLFSQVDIESRTRVEIVVDRSKNKYEMSLFDEKILLVFQETALKTAKISIKHRESHEELGLQAADLFCWGVSRKYEKNDTRWYELFSERITSEIDREF